MRLGNAPMSSVRGSLISKSIGCKSRHLSKAFIGVEYTARCSQYRGCWSSIDVGLIVGCVFQVMSANLKSLSLERRVLGLVDERVVEGGFCPSIEGHAGKCVWDVGDLIQSSQLDNCWVQYFTLHQEARWTHTVTRISKPFSSFVCYMNV